jgi:hypothetical protein
MSALPRQGGSAKWRPSSFTQYTNGRTASREDKRPDPSKGGLYDNRQKLGRMPSLPIFRGAEISGYSCSTNQNKVSNPSSPRVAELPQSPKILRRRIAKGRCYLFGRRSAGAWGH